jgi:PAS domain S-box-containing protein
LRSNQKTERLKVNIVYDPKKRVTEISNSDQNIKTLIDLGLTGTQAKTYLALLCTGQTSIKEIAHVSKVARPDTYRAILELQEAGIVEKIISIPTKFQSLPIKDAVDVLIARKIKENADLNARAIKLIESVKENANNTPPLKDDKLVLIPREAIEFELRKLVENARENICVMVSSKRMFHWVAENFGILKNALKREVTIRFITEDIPKLYEPKELEELKKSPFFEVRHNVGPLTAWFRVYDHKEVVLSTVINSEEPMHSAVWSNNRTLVELAQDYFESGWFSAIEPDEQAFKRDIRQFDYLFANMTDGFSYNKIILDDCEKPTDFVLLETNQAFEKITGVGKTMLGKKASEVFPEITKDLSDLLDIYGKTVLTGESVKFEYYFKRNDKWLSVLVYSPNKGYFVSIFEDITDRKKARDLLKESEEKYKHFTKYAPVAIYEIDCNTLQFKCVNDCMCELTGYTEEELLSKSPFDLLDDQSKADFQEIVRKSFAAEKVDETVDFRIIKKDGSKRWAALNAKLIYDKNKLVRAFVVARDVTERRCEEALAKKIRQAEPH